MPDPVLNLFKVNNKGTAINGLLCHDHKIIFYLYF